MSELWSELLRQIAATDDPEWEALLAHTRARGKALGIHSEEDVERLSDEYQREKREARDASRRNPLTPPIQ